jgi:hypothetical protein
MFLLKILDPHNYSSIVHSHWPVPHADGTPTNWRKLKVGPEYPIVLCYRGYHGWRQATDYLDYGVQSGDRLYLMEVRGTTAYDNSKVAASEARLIKYIGTIEYTTKQSSNVTEPCFYLVTPDGSKHMLVYRSWALVYSESIDAVNYIDNILQEGNP